MQPIQASYPPKTRTMVFIDGENMVCRFQDTLKSGKTVKKDGSVTHIKDVLVWQTQTLHAFNGTGDYFDYIRVTYYTSTQGNEETIHDLETKIKQLPITQGAQKKLMPFIVKRTKDGRSKGVDIKLCTDVLTCVYNNSADIIIIISGDADYLPLIEQVMKSGKQLYLAAFSKGLSPSLPNKVDQYKEIDWAYFESV